MAKGKKKETVAPVDAAAKQAEQRLAAIRDFNVNNMGEAWIDPNKVPTEDDVKLAKEEFEARTKDLQEKTYIVADAENSVRVAKFLKTFIENGFWAQRYFVGVINFSDYITKFIEEAEKEPKDLVMEYGPVQFCLLMFENYAGFGLESAKKMAELWDEYVPIYDVLRDHVEYYNAEAKMCEKLKQRWGMMAQGYYLVYLDPDEKNQPEADTTVDAKAEIVSEDKAE